MAETGVNVGCVDIDEKKIEKLNNGIISIYEPEELAELDFEYFAIGRKTK